MAFRRFEWPQNDVLVYLATNPDDGDVELWAESSDAYHQIGYLGSDGCLHLSRCTGEDDGDANDLGLSFDAYGYIDVVRD